MNGFLTKNQFLQLDQIKQPNAEIAFYGETIMLSSVIWRLFVKIMKNLKIARI